MPEASSPDALQSLWAELNRRYFQGTLPPIPIEWSGRLTSSAGMFISREGPRTRRIRMEPTHGRRVIRLSVPLLRTPGARHRGVLRTTLAHEMIHQWQFDVLKRRPNHGPDFCRKMRELNIDGLGITIRHRMDRPVQALIRYQWHCEQCGQAYERQRRSIEPSRHRCGVCRGPLRELPRLGRPTLERLPRLNRGGTLRLPAQLPLPFSPV